MSAPEGMDYMGIGRQIVQKNYTAFQQALKTQDGEQWIRDIEAFAIGYYAGQKSLRFQQKDSCKLYQLPCKDFQNHACASQIALQKEEIVFLLAKNEALMQRYLHFIQLPDYKNLSYSIYDAMIPPYNTLNEIGDIRLAQAVIAFDEGRADEGFSILQSEINFTKKMLVGEVTLFDFLVAARRLYVRLHLISSLLDMPSFQPYLHDERLQALLTPLTKEEQARFVQVLAKERSWVTSSCYTQIGAKRDESFIAQAVFERYYNHEATCNMVYIAWTQLIKRASLSLPEVSDLYVQGKLLPLTEEMIPLLDEEMSLQRQKYGRFFNAGGYIAATPDFLEESYEFYLKYFHELQIYMTLVNAKYQVAKESAGVNEVPELLKNFGAQGTNPYTQVPLQWNAITQSLSTTCLLSYRSMACDDERMSVHVALKSASTQKQEE